MLPPALDLTTLASTLVTSSPDAVMLLHPVWQDGSVVDFRCAHANAAAVGLFGDSVTRAGEPRLLEVLPGMRRAGLFAAFVQTLDSGGAQQVELRYDFDGLDRWLRVHATPLGDGAVLVTFADFTAVLERVNREKDEFLAIVSHELRTPLTAILGWVRLLRTEHLSQEKRERALETVERNARAQAQLVSDLLDMSRMITGKLSLTVRPVHPIQVVDGVIEALRPQIEGKGLRLVTNLDPRAGPIRADPDRLTQIVSNLINNAVKFTPRGGVVEVRLEAAEGSVKLIVADSGDGIAGSLLPHVFQRFRQSDSGVHRGGLGLGLAIVRHLVELHRGEVFAHSEGEGKGAVFTVVLPAAPERAAELQGARPAPAPSAVRLDGLRVLIVDDLRDTRELIATVLERAGAAVRAASSAAEALELLRSGTHDVLVSDLAMPAEDGIALIQQVRRGAADGASRIPAVALTAHARSDDRNRALLAGFQEHISKPVDPAELVSAVALLAGTRPVPES